MEILTSITEIIKELKGWQKVLAIVIITGAVVAVTLFSGGEEATKSVGDINQGNEQTTTNGDNTNSNAISF